MVDATFRQRALRRAGTAHGSRRLKWTFASGSVLLIVVAFYALAAPEIIYLPTVENIATFTGVLAMIATITNSYARTVFGIWALWFLVGAVSLFAQNHRLVGLNYDLDSSLANRFYLGCVGAAVLGGRLAQQAMPRSGEIAAATEGFNLFTWLPVLVFPFAYIASIIISTGTIPLLSGENVSATMYERDYGPLHGFGVFVVVACQILWMHFQSSTRSIPFMRRGLELTLLFGFLIAASFDGRRALTIFSVAGMLIFYRARPAKFSRALLGAIIVLLMLVGYVAAAALRSGREASVAFGTIWDPLASVGTEYRDFAYGFGVIRRSAVLSAGYDWLGSTVASIIPSFLLNIAGYDKGAMSVRDSAHTLMVFWHVDLGIRIGLPGELWFAYGWAAIAIFPFFGALIVGLATLAGRTRHYVYKAITLTGLSLAALAVLGQSTVTFGLILPLLYLTLAVAILDWLFGSRASLSGRRAARAR